MSSRYSIFVFSSAIGILLIALVVMGILWEREFAISLEKSRLDNLTQTIEEHARINLTRTEAALNLALKSVESAGDPEKIITNAQRAKLAATLRGLLPADKFVKAFVVFDRNGGIVADTLRDYTARPNNSTLAIFTETRDTPFPGMLIHPVFPSPVSGEWVMPFTRRISLSPESFDGVILAGVDPGYYQSFYDSINIGKNGFVTLFLRNGWIVARSPASDNFRARNWLETPLFRDHLPKAPAGTVQQRVAATGVESLYSYRALKDFPVVISLGISLEESLMTWRRQAVHAAWLLSVCLFLLIVAAWFMVRQKMLADKERQHLLESEQRFSQLAENIREVFWIIDPLNKKTLYVNPAFESIWGRPVESRDADPSAWLESIHPEDIDRVRGAVWRDDASTRDQQEYRILRPDGSQRWIRSRAAPARNASGDIYRIVRIAEDISERKSAEMARETLEAQLQHSQKLGALGTLASGVAHDFNNILATIQGNLDLAIADVNPDHSASVSLNEARNATLRAKHLVRQILTFSHSHRQARAVMDCAPVVEEAMQLLRATIPSSVSLIYTLDPDTPKINADATQIHQLLINLCSNAWQALPGFRGCVEIDVRGVMLDSTQASQFNNLKPGRHLCLSVKGNGAGMDAEALERMFDPFFTTKEPEQGAGLGLAVVYGIVQSHEGAITATSAPGFGTSVCAYFPEAADNDSDHARSQHENSFATTDWEANKTR